MRGDDFHKCLVGKRNLILGKTMFREILGYKMPLGDSYLLSLGVTSDFDEFHTVEKRGGDCREAVGCRNEEHFGEVIVLVDVVVVELAVLFRVKHFKQSLRWVTLIVGSDLVDFVKYHYGVTGAAFLQRCDYSAGHRPEIGASVSANLSLVVKSAECDSDILAAQGGGNRLAE